MSYFFRTLMKSRGSMLLFLPMLFLYASSYFQRTAVPGTIFNQLQSDLNLNAFQIAAMGASFVYIYALSQTFVGMLADKYGGDINILALNASDVADDISEFMEENEYTFEAARVSLEDSLYYYAQSIPITVVTDKDGVVQAYFRGSIDGEQMFSQYFDPLFTDLVEEAKEA